MSLRTRLLLSLAGSGLAILAGSWVAREFAVRYASEAAIRSSIEARIGAMDQATCEAGTDFDRPEARADLPWAAPPYQWFVADETRCAGRCTRPCH